MNVEISVTLLWVVALTQGLFLLVLYRQVGVHLLKRAEAISRDGPKVGSRLPAVIVTAMGKGVTASASRDVSQDLLLVFARPTCVPCKQLWPHLNKFMTGHSPLSVVVVLGGDADPDLAARYRAEHKLDCPVVADPSEKLFRSCVVRVSPFAVLATGAFRVKSKGLVNHAEHLRLLVRQGIAGRQDRMGALDLERSTDATELV